VAGSIRSIEKSSDLIGNRTRDLPTCSTAPQPTTLLRAPTEEWKEGNKGMRGIEERNYFLCH
jgi:hypothetical protein